MTLPPDQPERRQRRTSGPLSADIELWHGLSEGVLLEKALEDFYTCVFSDERLSPFFVSVTKERVMRKQFSFLRAIILGTRDYFGQRPKNAHHWMVISEDLFDHRMTLMAVCLRRAGIDEKYVQRMGAIEEVFRKHIVKSEANPMKMGGVAMPLDGTDRMVMTVGSVCDQCQEEINVGAIAFGHRRTGYTQCEQCFEKKANA